MSIKLSLTMAVSGSDTLPWRNCRFRRTKNITHHRPLKWEDTDLDPRSIMFQIPGCSPPTSQTLTRMVQKCIQPSGNIYPRLCDLCLCLDVGFP